MGCPVPMIEEGISRIVTLFDRPQGIASHCSSRKVVQATHDGPAGEVRPQPRVVTESRPRFLCRTNGQFGSSTNFQSGPNGVGFLAKAAKFVSAHQPRTTNDSTACS